MFLTKFDKKMYEEALRQEGREELEEKMAELSRDHAELSRNYAKRMFENGVTYDVAQSVITEITEEELKEIYGLR